MPALDLLETLDPTARAEYDAALPRAREFTRKLPYVHMVVRWKDDDDPESKHRRVRDVLVDGWLLKGNSSDRTRLQEDQLKLGHLLYLHAGRTHPLYGEVVFVFDELNTTDHNATPFGIGGLRCDCPEACECPGEPCVRGCMWPVSHWDTARQARFIEDSRWTASEWRERAAHFIALYFGDDVAAYFSDAPGPRRTDPEEIFAHSGVQDWRAWTVEVQARQDIDLRAHLAAGRIRFWGCSPKFEDYLNNDTVQDPFTRAPESRYPLMDELDAIPTITAPRNADEDWLELVNERIRRDALP